MNDKQAFYPNPDGLQDIELDNSASGRPTFYIDKSSISDVKTAIFLLFLFILVHVVTSFRTPSIIETDKQEFAYNESRLNKSSKIDIKLTSLQNSNRFVHIDGYLVRDLETEKFKVRQVNITTTITSLKDERVVGFDDLNQTNYEIYFQPNVKQSTVFSIFEKRIMNFDSIYVKLRIYTNYTDIGGFKFIWTYGDSFGPKYACSSFIILALMVSYMLIVFFNNLQFTSERFTQSYLIIIGVFSIVSSNPIGYFLPNNALVRIINSVLKSTFISIFRLFVLSQFEIILTSAPTPSKTFLISFGVFFFFYLLVESVSVFDRSTFLDNMIYLDQNNFFASEKCLIFFDLLYILINLVWMARSYYKSHSSRRLNFFAIISGLITVSILFSHIFCPSTNKFMNTVTPSMTYLSVHVTSAAFSIMMLSNCKQESYSTIKDENNVNTLYVEKVSDEDNESSSEEEDEEEEEEEEEE